MTEPEEKPLLSQSIKVIKKNKQILYLNYLNGGWLRTNETGHEILKLCNGKLSISDISEKLGALYKIPPKLVRSDVETFIQKCKDYHILDSDEKRPSSPKQLREVWLHVTSKCNLKCPYCYSYVRNDMRDLRGDIWKKVVNEAKEMNVSKLIISGGEPLLRKDLFEIISDKEANAYLITNGTLVTEEIAVQIAEKFRWIEVSLDGPSEEVNRFTRGEGNFERTVKGIELLRKHKFDAFAISAVPTRLNWNNIPDMVDIANKLKCNLHVNRYLPVGRGRPELELTPQEHQEVVEKTYKKYYEVTSQTFLQPPSFFIDAGGTPYDRPFVQYKRVSCGAGTSVLSISSQGDVYPCPLLHQEMCRLGNITEESLQEIYNRSLKRFADQFHVDRISSCENCEIKYICGGGCRANALVATQHLDGKDPYCEVRKKAIYQAMWQGNL